MDGHATSVSIVVINYSVEIVIPLLYQIIIITITISIIVTLLIFFILYW